MPRALLPCVLLLAACAQQVEAPLTDPSSTTGKADDASCLFERGFFYAPRTLDDSDRPVQEMDLVVLRSGDPLEGIRLEQVRAALGRQVASTDEALRAISRSEIFVSELEAQDGRRFTSVTYQNDGGRTFSSVGYKTAGAIFDAGTTTIVARVVDTEITECTAPPIAWRCRNGNDALTSVLSPNQGTEVEIAPIEWRAGRELFRARVRGEFGSSRYLLHWQVTEDGACRPLGGVEQDSEVSLVDDGAISDEPVSAACDRAARTAVAALASLEARDASIDRVEIAQPGSYTQALRAIETDGTTYMLSSRTYGDSCRIDGLQSQRDSLAIDLRR